MPACVWAEKRLAMVEMRTRRVLPYPHGRPPSPSLGGWLAHPPLPAGYTATLGWGANGHPLVRSMLGIPPEAGVTTKGKEGRQKPKSPKAQKHTKHTIGGRDASFTSWQLSHISTADSQTCQPAKPPPRVSCPPPPHTHSKFKIHWVLCRPSGEAEPWVVEGGAEGDTPCGEGGGEDSPR